MDTPELHTASPEPSPFFRLPRELRDTIYHFVFGQLATVMWRWAALQSMRRLRGRDADRHSRHGPVYYNSACYLAAISKVNTLYRAEREAKKESALWKTVSSFLRVNRQISTEALELVHQHRHRIDADTEFSCFDLCLGGKRVLQRMRKLDINANELLGTLRCGNRLRHFLDILSQKHSLQQVTIRYRAHSSREYESLQRLLGSPLRSRKARPLVSLLYGLELLPDLNGEMSLVLTKGWRKFEFKMKLSDISIAGRASVQLGSSTATTVSCFAAAHTT